MKKQPSGTTYVPTYRSEEHSEKQNPVNDFLPEECRIKSATDFYMFNTIACICTTFLFPPFIIAAAYFLYKAKKQKGGKNEI